MACGTEPSGSYAELPVASFVLGKPKRSTAPKPSEAASSASPAAALTGSCETPGIVEMGRGSLAVAAKNMG